MKTFNPKTWFTKKLTVPTTNDVKEVDTVQTWQVRWLSRNDKWHSSLFPELEVFLSEKDANDFADSLRNAYKLVRNTHEIKFIEVKKSKNGY
jgi:hypothetical protein